MARDFSGLKLPGDPVFETLDGPAVKRDKIKINGETVDCGFNVFQQFPKNKTVALNVAIGVNWSGIDLGVTYPRRSIMTRAFHPEIGSGARKLQSIYESGTKLFSKDNDGCVSDPGTDTDDVSYYADFHIINDKAPMSFPVGYNDSTFNNISDPAKMEQLLHADFSNIKQVSLLPPHQGLPVFGVSAWGNPPLIIFRNDSTDAVTAIHEWGHTQGLIDKSSPNNAIMKVPGFGIQNEINRDERATLSNPPPEL